MDQGIGDGSGGIRGLIDLIESHGDALNADLLRVGLRLRWLDDPDQDFTLGDLSDFVQYASPDMAIYRALYPEESGWDITSQLVASVLDFLVMRTWAEGGKKGRKPKQIPRPGVTDKETRTIRSAATKTLDRMDAWLAKRRKK